MKPGQGLLTVKASDVELVCPPARPDNKNFANTRTDQTARKIKGNRSRSQSGRFQTRKDEHGANFAAT